MWLAGCILNALHLLQQNHHPFKDIIAWICAISQHDASRMHHACIVHVRCCIIGFKNATLCLAACKPQSLLCSVIGYLLVYAHHSTIGYIHKENDGSILCELCGPCRIHIDFIWGIHRRLYGPQAFSRVTAFVFPTDRRRSFTQKCTFQLYMSLWHAV